MDDASPRLDLTRAGILAFRRGTGALLQRLPPSADSLRVAAWAGLTDSMPRAALLSIHARVNGTTSTTLDDPALVQVWGPRFSAYVVARVDRAVFTLGRLPDEPGRRRRAKELADRLEAFLAGREMAYGEAGRGLGVKPNELRYAAPTGRVLIQWDGARQPTISTVAPPEVDPADAQRELLRRYLHVLGPGTPAGFADWAGLRAYRGPRFFESLAAELLPVRTPIGDGWILAADEQAFRNAATDQAGGVRLLPSGDAYFLLQGAHRSILVPDPARRVQLWTPRVWPGALLIDGEVAGTWRRAHADLSVQPWRRLTDAERETVEAEASTLPLPKMDGPVRVRWDPA